MLITLPLAIMAVAAVAWRDADGPGGRRMVLGIAALAMGIRLLATLVISIVAQQVHITAVWLNDEASFFLATQSLLPNPLDRALPQGLDHLGGDGYLGLITTLSILGGGIADANSFRVINAAIGSIVVISSVLVVRQLFGARAALVTGVVLALWPTLVLWSATMLRDIVGSLTVVVVWWALARSRDLGWLRTSGIVLLSLVLALSLRPYLGGAIALGVVAWWMYPFLRRLSFRSAALLCAGALAIVVVGGVSQARRLDYAAHELLYRQTVTRMETLGRLYTDSPPPTENLPIKPGKAVGLPDPRTGWILGGIVQDLDGTDMARVAFTDESIRDVPLSQIVPIESTSIPPLQLVAWVVPNLTSYLAGTSATSEPSSPVWIAASLARDALLLATVIAIWRLRLSPREWLYPLCIVGGTVLALVAIPGAPGNAERHSATQMVPLLVGLASGLVLDWERSRRAVGLAVASIRTRPATEAAPASSRIRSAR